MNPIQKVIIAALIFGSSGSFIKIINLPVTSISFFRMFVPTFFLFIYFRLRKEKIFPEGWRLLMVASLLNALRMFFYFAGYTYTSIGTAVILLYTWPIFAVIYSIIFLKEPFSWKKTGLVAMAFAGVVLIYGEKVNTLSRQEMFGVVSILFSAMVYAGTIIIFKYRAAGISRWQSVFFQNFAGSFLFLPFFFINSPAPTPFQYSLSTAYSVLIGLAGFGLLFSALQKIEASRVSLINYLEVISAVALGIVLFNEELSKGIVVGGILILTSAFLINYSRS